jgi:ADP-ribose pyrophosphatase YjhB (NUDIX family)
MNARYDMVTVFVVRPDAAGSSTEFLQLKRSLKDYMGGTWAIIRGVVNQGESYISAALRELHEEACLVPHEFFRLGTVEVFYTADDDTLWHSVPFCAVVARADDVTLNDEHETLRWVPRGSIESETLWASERRLLADLCRDILDHGPAKPYLRIELEAPRP